MSSTFLTSSETAAAVAIGTAYSEVPIPVVTDQRSALASFIGFFPTILFKLISLATISVPLLFYRILTMSFTLHLNFTSMFAILLFLTFLVYLIIRYRYLNKYSRLKRTEPPQSTSSFFDLHPDDSTEEDAQYKPGFKNYPDEFLSAFLSSIKIFGYLEQHVFHELARHLQTKKLLAGDTLFRDPEQERSFYIVVHGHVQLFVMPDNHEEDEDEDNDWAAEDDSPRDRFRNYTLINEVGPRGTLSSLFTILSVFRESFIREEAKEKAKKHTIQQHLAKMNSVGNNQTGPSASTSTSASHGSSHQDPDAGWRTVFPNLHAEVEVPKPISKSTVHPLLRSPKTDVFFSRNDSDLDDTDGHEGFRKVSSLPRGNRGSKTLLRSSRYHSVHPNIIARATVDTTLAVIPEEAFHKLVQKFPRAAAHIVQVILTRFQRVTLMTGHRFLGLTKELLRLEKLVNESASMSSLPGHLFLPAGMERLKRQFEQTNADPSSSASAAPNECPHSESSGYISAMDIPSTPSIKSGTGSIGSPGPVGGFPSTPSNASAKNQEFSVEDDAQLRAAVHRCLVSCLSGQSAPGDNDIVVVPEASHSSPRETRHPSTGRPIPPESSRFPSRYYYPMDLFSVAGTADTSASPSLGALSVPYDDDIDAMSTVSSIHSGNDSVVLGDQNTLSVNDVEIIFYAKDAVLVREGEQNNGLYFVIDGLLEVSMTPADDDDISLERSPTDGTPPPAVNRDSSHKRKSRSSTFSLSPSPTPSTSSSSTTSQITDRDFTNATRDDVDKDNIIHMLQGTELVEKNGPVMASQSPAGRSGRSKDDVNDNSKTKKPLFVIRPGGLAGYLEAMTGHPSFVEIRAKQDTYVGHLSRKSLDRIIDRHPTIMLKLAQRLVGLLSPLILHIDIALEWMQVHSGQIICHEGQPSDSIYMVLHGRLRTIRGKKGGSIEIIDEFGRGDTVSELEALAGIRATATLHAIRDSEICRLPKTLFNALSLRYPEITLQISRMVASRSLEMVSKATFSQGKNVLSIRQRIHQNSTSYATAPELFGHNNANLRTVAIIPVNASVPVTEFAENLNYALCQSVGATCALLNSATITSVMGKHAFSRLGKLKLASWLVEQEEKFRIVLYLADSGVKTQWTRACIRQADTILLVGLGDGDPSVGEYERFLINMKTTARKELILLHSERFCATGTTQNWLKNRLWIQAHHHIFMPMRKHTTLTTTERFSRPPWIKTTGRKMTENSINMMMNMKGQLEKYYSAVPTFGRLLVVKKGTTTHLGSESNAARDDFARLARRLCGKTVALVLGGGGARGISHIGVIQALEEANIPIDIVGGTSIGSFVGGLYAKNRDLVSTIARSKMFSSRMTSIWRILMDLTYPVTAWFTGHEFNRSIFKCLGDSQIEDFWLPYFAVTTNITYSRMEVHTTGYAWRYIRASMSLSGYMPPICESGNMLVDGGYMDNLPVSVAKSMGADIIIAVDVASEDDTSPVHYGDSVSGWWVLLYNFNPFRSYTVPSIAEIQSRLAYVSSVSKLEEAKVTDGTLYVKMPVQHYGTLEFNKFNEIMQLGYDTGRQVIDGWCKSGYASGRLLQLDDSLLLPRGKQVKGKQGRRNSI